MPLSPMIGPASGTVLPNWAEKAPKGARWRNKFSKGEDDVLRQLVSEHGDNNWPTVAAKMKNRTARQCRERYNNYLSPRITNGPWTPEEDQLLAAKFAELNNSWAKIARCFDHRSDVNVKNRWTTLQSRGRIRPPPDIHPRIPQPPFYPIAPAYCPAQIYSVPASLPPPPMRSPDPPRQFAHPPDSPVKAEPRPPDQEKQLPKSPSEPPVTQGEFENMDDPWPYDNAPDTSYSLWT
jgi:hypothetical protein